MTEKIKAAIHGYYRECMRQIRDRHYPRVNSETAQHQLYGYIKALEDIGFCDESERHEIMEKAAEEFPRQREKLVISEKRISDTSALDMMKDYAAQLDKEGLTQSHSHTYDSSEESDANGGEENKQEVTAAMKKMRAERDMAKAILKMCGVKTPLYQDYAEEYEALFKGKTNEEIAEMLIE